MHELARLLLGQSLHLQTELLTRLSQDAAQPRVTVLKVKHWVVETLLFGLLDVENDRRIVTTAQIVVSQRIGPRTLTARRGVDLFDNLIDRYQIAEPLAHFYFFSVPKKLHELVQQHFKPLLRKTKCRKTCPHARHVAVVVRAKDVDQTVVAA